MNKKNKIFILGYIGYDNLGDDITANILCRSLSSMRPVVLASKRYLPCAPAYIYRYNIVKFFFSIRPGDILLNLNGLFQDITGRAGLLYYFLMNILFILRGGKISFINTEFSDVRHLRNLVHFLMKRSVLSVAIK